MEKSKSKKLLPVVLAVTAIAAMPFATAPKAYAIDDVDVEADDYDVEETTEYTITFTLDEDLNDGDEINIHFDSNFNMDDVDDSDISVDIEGDDESDMDDIVVDGQDITITVADDYSEGDAVEIKVDNVTNPDDDGTYDIDVETDNEDEETFTVEIGDDADDDDNEGAFDVDLSDDEEGEESSYEFSSIDISDDDLELEEDGEVTVAFPDEDMLPDEEDYDEGDITINGYDVEEIDISGDEVVLTIPADADGEDELEIEFSEDFGIENPDADDYTITVEYDGEEYESEEFEITDGGSSSGSSRADSDFAVSLSDSGAGARSSYTFEADFGSNYKLEPGKDVIVTFPSSDMLPPSIDSDTVYVNGKESKNVYISGSKVYVTASDSISKTGNVKVSFGYYSWITNPKTAGSYDIAMSVSGKTITSKKFTISGTAVVAPTVPTGPIYPPVPTVPTTPAPVTANNNLAVVTKTKAGLGQVTGFNIQVKQVAEALAAGKDYLQVSLPVGFKVPPAIPITNTSVNGVYPNKVVVSGQNILIYPKQNIAQNAPATIIITEAAKITNPAVKNVYSISVSTSAHQGPLFSRLVGIGGAVVPAVTPAPTPVVTFPVNAARIKVNVANFTLYGNTYPLTVAPMLANGTTTAVPAQFFKEALSLSTIWNNNTVSIVSGSTAMRFTVGSNIARVGINNVTMPAPVTLKNGMPMIPLRFVADQIGYKVLWDAKTSSVAVFR